MILYRPVGTAELELIHKSGDKEFPPRLPEQPIFYPVLNEQYACEIAEKWNTKTGDGFGYVTRFEIDDAYISQFEVHTVGNHTHQELWVPAESLAEFNAYIKGVISVIKTYYEKELTLLTGIGKERVPVKLEFGSKETKISIEYNRINYIGKGKDVDLDESIANLQKSLPDGVLIACCNTCRHGNHCPYGNDPYLYCTKDRIINSKLDMADLFNDRGVWEREVWPADYCSDYCRQDDDHYTYNGFLYCLKHGDSISLNGWFCSVVAQTASYLGQHGFRRSGKTNSFYKINSDRTKGCLIVFRQSLDNTPEYKKFGINFICLTQNDTPDRSRITVNLLRQNTALNGLPIDAFQIDETLINNVTPGSYFTKSIRPKLDRILSECQTFGII